MPSPIAVDYETFFSSKLKYGLRTQIAEQYCSHELFDCYLISVCDGTTSWAGHPKDFNWSALDNRVWLSHNVRFDKVVYEELVRRKLAPKLNVLAHHCTANLTSYTCNRRALKDAVEHLFKGESVSKEYRGVADGKHWPGDYTVEEREQVLSAGRSDAQWCWRLFDKYGPNWPQVERDLSALTVDQGMRGVAIDTEKLNDYLAQTHEMLANTEKVIPWLSDSVDEDSWDEFNTKPTSTKCIAEQCRRTGIPCAPVKSDDEEAYALWEQKHGPANPWIYAVGAWRSINKLYKTFLTIKERIRPDGTLPFGLKYFGACTGRWSGDSRVNLQNQRKRPIMCNEHGLLETNDKRVDAAVDEIEEGRKPEWVRHIIDFRSIIVPRAGRKMIVSDLAQIEPRVLAWLAGNWDMLREVASGKSVYEAHARATMGFSGPDRMDKKSELYRLAKARVLGLGYACGWEKFITMAWDLSRYDVTKDDPEWIETEQPFTGKVIREPGYGFHSKRIVAEFRAQNPLLAGDEGLWRQLGNAFKSSIGGDFVMTLPNGRKMRYENVRASVRLEKDPVTGKPRRVNVFTANTDGKIKKFYGGKLTENLTQAVARDVFAEQVARMVKKNKWDCLFTIHDEAVMEVDQSVTAREVEHEMSYCPEWLRGCPVNAEAKEVATYCK